MNYNIKYLKYKSKYIELKSQIGGVDIEEMIKKKNLLTRKLNMLRKKAKDKKYKKLILDKIKSMKKEDKSSFNIFSSKLVIGGFIK
jgi:hypothetical protein